MPRSNKLKDTTKEGNAGVHKVVKCPFCDRIGIRSDHFKAHFETHHAGDGETAYEFVDRTPGHIVIENCVVHSIPINEDVQKCARGMCYMCKKIIENPTPRSSEIFEKHVCRKAVVANKSEKAVKEIKPPDFKGFWETMGKLKMSEKQREWYDGLADDEKDYNERCASMVRYFVRTAGVKAPAPAPEIKQLSGWINYFISHEEVSRFFELDESEEDVRHTIVEQLKGIDAIHKSWTTKLEKVEAKYEQEIAALTTQNSEYVQARKQDGLLLSSKQAENDELQRQVQELTKRLQKTSTNGFKAL